MNTRINSALTVNEWHPFAEPGDSPVPFCTKVTVKRRNGSVSSGLALEMDWRYCDRMPEFTICEFMVHAPTVGVWNQHDGGERPLGVTDDSLVVLQCVGGVQTPVMKIDAVVWPHARIGVQTQGDITEFLIVDERQFSVGDRLGLTLV